MLFQKPNAPFNFKPILMEKVPCGLFSFLYHYKFLLFIVVSITTVYSSENQNFGLIVYHANKWDNSIIKTHDYDIYNNGLYSLADLNFGPFNIFNSMFATPDSLAARKGGLKK